MESCQFSKKFVSLHPKKSVLVNVDNENDEIIRDKYNGAYAVRRLCVMP